MIALLLVGCSPPPFSADEWEQLGELSLCRAPAPELESALADRPLQALGLVLYLDQELSVPADDADPVSCRSCHDLGAGGADHGQSRSPTAGGGTTARNSPSLTDVRHRSRWGWLGQFDDLAPQISLPLIGPGEHGYLPKAPYNALKYDVADHVRARHAGEYARLFPAAEPDEAAEVTYANVLLALSAFVVRPELDSVPSALDRVLEGGDPWDTGELTDAELRGARLFVGKAGCDHCHSGPFLTDGRRHNTGVGDPSGDPGAWNPRSGRERARLLGAFQTPPLRGIADTGPYFHTGGDAELWEVVDHYVRGGDAPGEFAGTSEIGPLTLTEQETYELEAFLGSLRGPDPDRIGALLGPGGCVDPDEAEEVLHPDPAEDALATFEAIVACLEDLDAARELEEPLCPEEIP